MSHDKLSFINQSQALSSGLVNPGYPSCCTIRKKKKKYLKEIILLPLSVIFCCNIRNSLELFMWLPDTLFSLNRFASHSSSEWNQYGDYVTITLLNVLSCIVKTSSVMIYPFHISHPHSAVWSDTGIWSDPGIRLPCALKGLSFRKMTSLCKFWRSNSKPRTQQNIGFYFFLFLFFCSLERRRS